MEESDVKNITSATKAFIIGSKRAFYVISGIDKDTINIESSILC